MPSRMKKLVIISMAMIYFMIGATAAECESFTCTVNCAEDIAARALLAIGDVVSIVRSFAGNLGPGWKPSIDAAGAVGPEHVVDFDVAGFVVHDKVSGRILRKLSTRDFWQQVKPEGKLVPKKDANDARILYDPLSKHWIACAAGTTEPDCFLAVSSSSDPTKPWHGAKLPLPRINPYMRMGVDKNGLYICSSNGNADFSKGTNCYVIPMHDVLAEGGPVLTRAQSFKDVQFSAMPAMDPDPDKPADAPAILLANKFMDGICSELYLYKITWSGPKASISAVQTIPLSKKYLTPNNSTAAMEAFQPKPGPKLRAGGGGRRIDSAFVRNGSVFGCNGAKRNSDSRPGVLWYEVRIRDGRLMQEGLVDSSDRDFIFPSIAVDSKGNIGIGCTGTSQTEFPSVYVMMHAATDPANTMRKPVVAVPGTTSYHYAGEKAVNFSHYSTTCIDPSNPEVLWTYQGYGNSKIDRQWCTAWAAFQLPAGEPELTTIPLAPGSRPQAIVSGPDGAVWFGTLTNLCKIGSDRKIAEIPLPDHLKGAGKTTVLQYLAVGPDKQLWAVFRQGNVVSISLSGKFTTFPIPTPNAGPWHLTLGPDGNLWFTELNGHKIGKVTTKGDITEFPVPSKKSGPYSIVTGSDGALWFTEYNRHHIGRITTKGEITEFPTPKHGEVGPGGPRGICLGADGALWFTAWAANKIGRMTMKGEVTEFDIPTPRSGAIGIAAGPDGNIWFCENKGGKIGRITPGGKIIEYPIAEGSEPISIIAGPDGNMWFTDLKDRIGHLRIPAREKPAKKN